MSNTINAIARAFALPRPPEVQSNREAATIVHRFLQANNAHGHPGLRHVGQELFNQLGLGGNQDAQPTPQTRSFVRLIQILHHHRNVAGWDRLSVAVQWSQLKPESGARQALTRLAADPRFFSHLSTGHRNQVARLLGRTSRTRTPEKVRAFVQKLLANRYFQAASDQGKTNALGNPARTLNLLQHPDLLPTSAGRAQKEASRFIADWLRNAKPASRQKWLGWVTKNHPKFVARYFEDVPAERAAFNRSVWYGEALQQSFGTDWAQKVFNFLKTWHQTNACLSVHGAGSACSDPYAGFTPKTR